MIEALKNQTYMVRHNPNCPSPFEVRLSGLGLLIEWQRMNSPHMPPLKNGDDVGYGQTAEEAAAAALRARACRLDEPKRAADLQKFREMWEGL